MQPRLSDDPFPHVRLEAVLPPALYRRVVQVLRRSSPAYDSAAQVEKDRSQQLRYYLNIDRLDQPTQRVVAAATSVLESPETLKTLVGLLAGTGFCSPMCRFRTQTIFSVDRPGYSLRPHVDRQTTILAIIAYYPGKGQESDHGTTLYRVTESLVPSDSPTTRGSRGIGKSGVPLITVPYEANTGLAFQALPACVHGVRRIPQDHPPRYISATHFFADA